MARTQDGADAKGPAPDWLSEIIDLLRAKTAHDFTLYKKGTLQRRIERRMAMSSIETSDMNRYLEVLRSDEPRLNSSPRIYSSMSRAFSATRKCSSS